MMLLAAEEACLAWVMANKLVLIQDWPIFLFCLSERTVVSQLAENYKKTCFEEYFLSCLQEQSNLKIQLGLKDSRDTFYMNYLHSCNSSFLSRHKFEDFA
jgi:hypothetical protein